MISSRTRHLFATGFALLVAATTQATPYLIGAKPNHVAGPELKPEDFKGRAVVIANWGVACDVCWGHIPMFQAWAAKYPKTRAIVVANNIYGGDPENRWKERIPKSKAPLALMNHAGFETRDFEVPGTPLTKNTGKIGVMHMWIYDAYGRLVFDGVPDDKCEKVFKAAAANSPLPDAFIAKWNRAEELFGRPIHPALLEQACALADQEKDSAPTLAKLKTASAAGGVAEAASAMIAAYDEFVADSYRRATELEATAPSLAVAGMERLARSVPAKEAGVNAKARLAAWAKDAAFQKEASADKAWQKLKERALREKKANAAGTVSASVDAEAKLLLQWYPGTKAAAKAREAMDSRWKSVDTETQVAEAK